MKVAQIAPLYEAVPPSLYGGIERIVAHLTNALAELGMRSRCSRARRPTHGRHSWWHAIICASIAGFAAPPTQLTSAAAGQRSRRCRRTGC